MSRILVIASNSFTGSHFINHSLKEGHNIVGISRSNEYSTVMLPYLYEGSNNQSFRFNKLDVNNDLENILKICDDFEPEIIANFSAQGEVRTSWLYPMQWYETNTMAVVKLTDELRKRSYIKKYITASTPEVYGSTVENIKENHNYNPSTPYAASKLAGDLHLMTLFKRYNFPVVFTRSANVYGIHQQLYRIIPRTIIYLRLKKKIQLHGGGKTNRSFIHIRDVAKATLKIAQNGRDGDVYHISPNNEEISIRNLVKTICNSMDYDFDSSVEFIDQNFGQDSRYSISSAKLITELNWKPEENLMDGIEEMIKWIDDNWSEISSMPLDYIHKQ